jgi:hypothetical protein
MTGSRTSRLLVVAGLLLAAGPVAATAQTVIATNAPRGMEIEVVLNGTPVGSAAVDPDGVATIPIDKAPGLEPQMDVLVAVDVCDERRRVVVTQTGLQPPPREAGCVRREITGVFVVRPASRIVLDLSGVVPRMFLIQGAFDPLAPPPPRAIAPSGLVLSAGAGLTRVRDAADVFCGNVANCDPDGLGLGYTAGGQFWIGRYVGAEVTYVKPAEVSAEGGGDTYRFNSTLDAELFTIAGLAGAPVGPVRIYGKGGANFSRALVSTTQIVDDRPITIDGDVVGIARGGTQLFQYRTEGWSWLVGGGLEAWVRRPFAIYVEFTLTDLRGADEVPSEAELRDRLTSLIVGVRFSLPIGR